LDSKGFKETNFCDTNVKSKNVKCSEKLTSVVEESTIQTKHNEALGYILDIEWSNIHVFDSNGNLSSLLLDHIGVRSCIPVCLYHIVLKRILARCLFILLEVLSSKPFHTFE
jgi:hypothetical protein